MGDGPGRAVLNGAVIPLRCGGRIGSGDVGLHEVIAANLGSGCNHEPVCLAIHLFVEPSSPTSDHYCCRATGSLCEAIYDGYYDGIRTGDRVGAIQRSVEAWTIRSDARPDGIPDLLDAGPAAAVGRP